MRYKRTLGLLLVASMALAACTQNETTPTPKEEPTKPVEKVEPQPEVNAEEEAELVTEAQTDETQNQSLQITTKQLVKEGNNQEQAGLFLDLVYPVISGMENEEEQEKLNARFLTMAQTMEETVREEEALLQEAEASAHAGANLAVETHVNNGRIISLNMVGYQYLGGANGTPFNQPFVYDVKEEKEITLGDLFDSDVFPEKELVALVNEAFEQSEYSDMLFEPVTSLSPHQPFYLTDDAVVLAFDKYEYTAGAAGAPLLSFDKSQLPPLKKGY